MHIMVIDDEPLTLEMLGIALKYLGHSCVTFSDPVDALDHLGRDVDIVIADVHMPVLDGYGVAQRVAEQLGNSPPRTVLISGDHPSSRLEETSCSAVIGLLPKPFLPSDLFKVLNLLATARERCPGKAITGCECREARDREPGEPVPICETDSFAACPHYDGIAGPKLRRVILECAEVVAGP